MRKFEYFSLVAHLDGPVAKADAQVFKMYLIPETVRNWAPVTFSLSELPTDLLGTNRLWTLMSEKVKEILASFDRDKQAIWLPVVVRTGAGDIPYWICVFGSVPPLLHPLSFVDGKMARTVLLEEALGGRSFFSIYSDTDIGIDFSVKRALVAGGVTGADYLKLPVRKAAEMG